MARPRASLAACCRIALFIDKWIGFRWGVGSRSREYIRAQNVERHYLESVERSATTETNAVAWRKSSNRIRANLAQLAFRARVA